MNVFYGIDPSLRSTGVVSIDERGYINTVKLIIVPSTVKDEENLLLMAEEIAREIEKPLEHGDMVCALGYERLAFNAPSAVKDKISGSYWLNRIYLKDMFRNYDLPFIFDVISATQWRSKIVTSEDRKAAKEKGVKLDLKETAYEKLPEFVKTSFMSFLDEFGLKRKHIYDLTDAYWIAYYVKEKYVASKK